MIRNEKALGRWVRRRREELGLTQEELAAQMGKTKGYINKIELASPHSDTGKPPAPTLELLYNLSQKLGASLVTPLIELGYLKHSEADRMGIPTGATPHRIRILLYYDQLSERDQQTAVQMIQLLLERAKEAEPKTKEPKAPATKKTKSA